MLKKFMMMAFCAVMAIVVSGCFHSEPDISGIYLGERATKPEQTIIIELKKGADMEGRAYKDYKDGYVVNIYSVLPEASAGGFLNRELNEGYALPPDENGLIRVYGNPKAGEKKGPTPSVVKLQGDGNLFGVTAKDFNPFYKKTYVKQKEKSVDELSARLKSEYRKNGK